jgi:hypothetical protein
VGLWQAEADNTSPGNHLFFFFFTFTIIYRLCVAEHAASAESPPRALLVAVRPIRQVARLWRHKA